MRQQQQQMYMPSTIGPPSTRQGHQQQGPPPPTDAMVARAQALGMTPQQLAKVANSPSTKYLVNHVNSLVTLADQSQLDSASRTVSALGARIESVVATVADTADTTIAAVKRSLWWVNRGLVAISVVIVVLLVLSILQHVGTARIRASIKTLDEDVRRLALGKISLNTFNDDLMP